MNIENFFSMGKYTYYVWSAWGISVIILCGLILHAKKQKKTLIQSLKRQKKREQSTQDNAPL